MKNKKSVILYINTSDNRKTEITVSIDGKEHSKSVANNWASQMLLPLIDEILKSNKITIRDLTEIKMHTGPGSFTGLRVGVAVANALAYLLKIPVNGNKEQPVTPQY